MPIPIDEYNKGLEPEDNELLAVLEMKPYQAYTMSELVPVGKNPLFNVGSIFTLRDRLARLVRTGQVKSKVVGQDTYYVSAKAGAVAPLRTRSEGIVSGRWELMKRRYRRRI